MSIIVNKNIVSSEMVAKSKNKVVPCSTPEARPHSPSSDSLCDSEAASPVPFLCTQDGAEGETDVVWNFYTPKSEHADSSRFKNSTPLSRKGRKLSKASLIEKPILKRKQIKPTQKRTELFQDLIELNQNLHEMIAKKSQRYVLEKPQSGSEDDIFIESVECSPKSGPRTNSRCLRRNVLSSKFKPETETVLESDDSMNECLIKASQVVEESILNNDPEQAKRPRYASEVQTAKPFKSCYNLKMDQDSMDAILNSIKLHSPIVNITKKIDSPRFNNDSFDSFVGNLDDSALERLTQMPVKNQSSNRSKLNSSNADWMVQEMVVYDGKTFGRHNSMPESPSLANTNKPSTSGMVFGRYNTMPHDKNDDQSIGDSPIKCTPEEIKRKRQQAREKLLAKRLLPFTSSQHASQALPIHTIQPTQQAPKKPQFQPKVASTKQNIVQKSITTNALQQKTSDVKVDLKSLIEKKRQEALMKLRRRQHPTKP